jgi:hypothetical protein
VQLLLIDALCRFVLGSESGTIVHRSTGESAESQGGRVRSSSRLLATTFVSVMGMGCGSDGDAGVTDNKTIGDLSSAEVATVCKSVQSKMDRLAKAFVSITCTQIALVDEGTCTAERKSCVADPPEEATLGAEADFDCAADSQESITNDCPKLTVGELQGCLESVVKTFETTASSYTCSSEGGELASPGTPKACMDLKGVCPMLADFSGNT